MLEIGIRHPGNTKDCNTRQATMPDLKTTPLGTLATDTLQKINMKAPKASITI